MVSLIDRLEYYRSIEDKPKITYFINFIKGETLVVAIPNEINETDKLYFFLMQAIANTQKDDFIKYYTEFSRRKPSTENAWIYNDFLIFILICGIEKYHLDKLWITEVTTVRSNDNQQYQAINQTFHNIIKGNIQSSDNLKEIVVVFLELVNSPQLSKDLLDRTYSSLAYNSKILETKNDFLIALSLRAFDIILLTKETSDENEISSLKHFKVSFLKRIKNSSYIIYFLILGLLIFLSIRYMHKYVDVKDYVHDLSAIFHIFGIGFAVLFKWIRAKIEWLLLELMGYNKSF